MPWFHRVSPGTADEPSLRAVALLLGLRLREPHLRSFRSIALCKSLGYCKSHYFLGIEHLNLLWTNWTLERIELLNCWTSLNCWKFWTFIEPHLRSIRSIALCKSLVIGNQYYFWGLNIWTYWSFSESLNFFEPIERIDRSLNQLNSWTHWTFWTLEPFELLNVPWTHWTIELLNFFEPSLNLLNALNVPWTTCISKLYSSTTPFRSMKHTKYSFSCFIY